MTVKLSRDHYLWMSKASRRFATANLFLLTPGLYREQNLLWFKKAAADEKFADYFEQVFGDSDKYYRLSIIQLPNAIGIDKRSFFTVFTNDDSWKIKDALVYDPDLWHFSFTNRLQIEFDRDEYLSALKEAEVDLGSIL